MRTARVLALGMTAMLIAACSGGGGASTAPTTAAGTTAPAATTAATEGPKEPIRIGSDNFYESKLVAEIYAQVLEKAGYTVERKFGLGSRQERIPPQFLVVARRSRCTPPVAGLRRDPPRQSRHLVQRPCVLPVLIARARLPVPRCRGGPAC